LARSQSGFFLSIGQSRARALPVELDAHVSREALLERQYVGETGVHGVAPARNSVRHDFWAASA
jgi:hypothetical protein